MSDKYRMPDAMPRSIPTSCIIVNMPSLFYTSSQCSVNITTNTMAWLLLFIITK